MFNGSCVALVTPMTPQGEIDETAVIDLVEWHISERTQGIVVAGSTGEAATLSIDEQQRLIALVYKTARRRIPVIAGTGTNATATTIQRTQMAKDIGVDACLIVTPYYNRPTQEGLIQHYSHVANAVDIPILLYNVPTRTGCDLQPVTVGILSEIPNIIGIKEAGPWERIKDHLERCGKDFLLYTGDDFTACDFMLSGGHGNISASANVVPALMQKMCQYAIAKEEANARAMELILQPLHQMLFVETNPIAIKWALHQLGKIESGIRLPLTPLSTRHQGKLKEALQIAKIH